MYPLLLSPANVRSHLVIMTTQFAGCSMLVTNANFHDVIECMLTRTAVIAVGIESVYAKPAYVLALPHSFDSST